MIIKTLRIFILHICVVMCSWPKMGHFLSFFGSFFLRLGRIGKIFFAQKWYWKMTIFWYFFDFILSWVILKKVHFSPLFYPLFLGVIFTLFYTKKVLSVFLAVFAKMKKHEKWGPFFDHFFGQVKISELCALLEQNFQTDKNGHFLTCFWPYF